jgi:lysophospholipase L1-like esterase
MAKQHASLDRHDGPAKKAAVLAFSAAKPTGPGAGASHAALRVIAFGSSSTQGAGASSPSASYPAQLQVDLMRMVPKGETVEVVNRGIGGQDADDMIQRLQSDVIAPRPNVVIWQTGSNDPLRECRSAGSRPICAKVSKPCARPAWPSF